MQVSSPKSAYNWMIFSLMKQFKTGRMERFVDLFKPTDSTTILDVGGLDYYWRYINASPRLTVLNLPGGITPPADTPENIKFVEGDGCWLDYPDGTFDIVFSNSVIEHVHIDKQMDFAHEISRVSKGYFLQVPYRWALIEPHYMTIFVHFLPRSWQKRLLRWLSIWGLMKQPQHEEISRIVDSINLLTVRDMERLFPDAIILKERFLGFVSCLIAYRPVNRSFCPKDDDSR